MAPPSLPWLSAAKTQQEEEEDEQIYRKYSDFVSTLPEDRRWPWAPLRRFQGFWYIENWLPSILATREHFAARPTDVFLATSPNSGTTWFKSIVFSLLRRGRHPPQAADHPLRRASPHDVVYLLDELYRWRKNPDLAVLPAPRIFSTHCPYSALPESVRNSGCRIIYVARNPKDSFVSRLHFWRGLNPEGAPPISVDGTLETFCSGICHFGPIWDHLRQYWDEHLRRPDRVRFFKYETTKADPVGTLKEMAAFLGCPFSPEEEEEGVPESISDLCSFGNMSNLEINRSGALERELPVQKKLFFRRGEVGDYVNHLTPEMAAKLDGVADEKLGGSGLNFSS